MSENYQVVKSEPAGITEEDEKRIWESSQPAKESLKVYYEKRPFQEIPMVTTTTTTTSTKTKDITSTATSNPFWETYTTTVTPKPKDLEDS